MKSKNKRIIPMAAVGCGISLVVLTGCTTDPMLDGDRTVTVTGTATVTSVPTDALMSIQVEKSAPSLAQASRDVDEAVGKVVKVAHKNGVKDSEIEASSQESPDAEGEAPTASSSVALTVPIEKSGAIRSAIRELGEEGVRVDARPDAGSAEVQDKQVLDARSAAVDDARVQAESLAGAAHARLGEVKTISASPQAQIMPQGGVSARMANAPDVMPGSAERSVSVEVVYLLES